MCTGTSLVVQWLRLHTPNARDPGSVPSQGTRPHMPRLRVRMQHLKMPHSGLPWRLNGKESAYQCWRHRFDPWPGKTPYAKEQLTLCAPLLSLCSGTQELQQEEPCNEKPTHCNCRKAQGEAKTQHSQKQIKLRGIIFKKDPTYHNKLFYMCVCVGPARQSFPTSDWTQAIAGEAPNPNH